MKNLLLNKNVIIFFEFSRMLLSKKNFNFNNFKKFLDFYKLYILDLNLNLINVKDLLYNFSKLEKKKNTIGDYILVKDSFYRKNIK
jgi:hypothetical protein